MKDVRGKTAFVTGGASGIGMGISRALLDAGARVVVADAQREYLDEARATLASFQDRVHFLQVDVRNRAEMADAEREACARFGKVHILCNNAGVSSAIAIEEAGYDEWDWVMGINVGGVINGIVSFLPGMKAHGEGGHIVNTASMAALIPGPGWIGVYTASKFAVRGITESLRLSLGGWKIGVSLLCPGAVNSRIAETAKKLRPAIGAPQTSSEDDGGAPAATVGKDPLEIGRDILRGIVENRAFIITHDGTRDEVAEIFDRILTDFPNGDEADPQIRRFEAERRKWLAQARAEAESV